MSLIELGDDIRKTLHSTPKKLKKRKSSKQKTKRIQQKNEARNKLKGYLRISKLIEYDNFSSFAIAIKNVIETKQETEIDALLDWYITYSEEEILEVCKHNYETFLRFAEELKSLNRSTVLMKSTIDTLTRNLSVSTTSFYESLNILNMHTAIKKKTEQTIDELEAVLFILRTVAKINMYIEDQKYNLALNKLNKLENVYMNGTYSYTAYQKIKIQLATLKNDLNNKVRSTS